MKAPLLSLAFSWLLVPQLVASASAPVPKLVGIFNLPNHKAALLETAEWELRGLGMKLGEGVRCGEVEVNRINPERGEVDLRLDWTNTLVTVGLQRQGSRSETAAGSIELVDATVNSVLSLYAECKGRSLLRWPRLPSITFTLAATTTNQAQVARLLGKALADAGISTIPDGDKFVMVVPASETASVKSYFAEAKSLSGIRDGNRLIGYGSLHFPNTDLIQVARIYADLVGRSLDLTQRIPEPLTNITFRNETEITKEECIYAFDTLFHWQGIKVVRVGDDLVRIARE